MIYLLAYNSVSSIRSPRLWKLGCLKKYIISFPCSIFLKLLLFWGEVCMNWSRWLPSRRQKYRSRSCRGWHARVHLLTAERSTEGCSTCTLDFFLWRQVSSWYPPVRTELMFLVNLAAVQEPEPSWCSCPHTAWMRFAVFALSGREENDYWNKKLFEEKEVSENTSVCSKQSDGFLPRMWTPQEADGWALCQLPQKHPEGHILHQEAPLPPEQLCTTAPGLFPTIDWSQTDGAQQTSPHVMGSGNKATAPSWHDGTERWLPT